MNARSPFVAPDRTKLAEIDARSTKRSVHLLSDVPRHSSPSETESASPPSRTPRPFTPGEKSLIRKVHGYMPPQQLLEVLNERLISDQGPGAMPRTIEELYAEIGATEAVPASANDWSSLRKLVANARRSGVLDAINRQVIDDFAVVFSLSAGQVLRLQDVLLRAKEGDEA
jgi:hypothetical protein